MKFSTLVGVASAIASITAAPAGEPVTDIEKRVDNGAHCQSWLGTEWGFRIETWGERWDDDWGKGLLDNLRGQCGEILDWRFEYLPSHNGVASFRTRRAIRAHCVEDAIWLASGPQNIGGVQCQNSG
ncbi:hypothetical protein ABW20_dc0101658 [Dactylellina cionopaga]|nr:hypothetical protein ABW20_dc0101658 [Dactylellina cionopaga]